MGKDSPPFILINGALQRQLEPGQALMSAHSLSPALCPHIKALDPPVPEGGKRAAGTLLVPWLLPRAGWTWGKAGDRLHQMGPEERGLRGGGSLGCLARCVWGSPLSLAGRAPVTLLAANMGTDRPLCLHLQLPLPSSKTAMVLGRTHGKDAQSSAPACLPVSQPLARSPLVPRDSLGGSKESSRWSRNSKGGLSRQTWPCPHAGHMIPPAGAGFAASCACPAQPLHKGLPTALRGWRSSLICNELFRAG